MSWFVPPGGMLTPGWESLVYIMQKCSLEMSAWPTHNTLTDTELQLWSHNHGTVFVMATSVRLSATQSLTPRAPVLCYLEKGDDRM
jgi:hypothetical protein